MTSNGMNLSSESILMQYGYNVSQTKDLSEYQRQKILVMIIEHEVLSKNEIIGYLDFFIRQRKGRKIYKNAIEKWEKDKEFVESYRKGSFRMVGIGSITRK